MIVYTNKYHIPFLIDDEDWDMVRLCSWSIHHGYPKTNVGRYPQVTTMPIHLKQMDFKIEDAPAYEVRNGVTFLALITFTGKRHNIRIHAGALHTDERTLVYDLKRKES